MANLLTPSKLELLTQQVVYEHSIITYRVAARMFKMGARDAKSLLRAFHEQSEGRTHATLLVSGYIKLEHGPAANGTQLNGDAHMDDLEDDKAYVSELKTVQEAQPEEMQCIMLVPEDELQAKLESFTRVTSNEVYSVEPNKLPDLVLLSVANAPIRNDAALAAVDPTIIGVIAHSRKSVKKTGKASKSSTTASTSASSSKAASSSSKPDLKRKASSVDVASASTSASTSTKPSTSSKLAANSSKDKEKAKEAPKEKAKSSTPAVEDLFKKGKEKESAKEGASTAKKASPAKGKEKKAQEDMEIDEDEYDALLADDDDLMAEIDDLDTAQAKKPSKASTSKSAADDKKASDSSKPAKKDKVLKSGSKRKTRRVTKKVVTTNAKGFKVTKEVETDESYSGSEDDDEDGPTVASSSKPAEKEKSKPAKKEKESTPSSASGTGAKKKSSAGKPGEQASLKNFFGKPKAASKK